MRLYCLILILSLTLACSADELATTPGPPPNTTDTSQTGTTPPELPSKECQPYPVACEGINCELALKAPQPNIVEVELLPPLTGPKPRYVNLWVCNNAFQQAYPEERACQGVQPSHFAKPTHFKFQVWPGSQVYAFTGDEKELVWEAPSVGHKQVSLVHQLAPMVRHQVSGKLRIGGLSLREHWAARDDKHKRLELLFSKQGQTMNTQLIRAVTLSEGQSDSYDVSLPPGRWDVYAGYSHLDNSHIEKRDLFMATHSSYFLIARELSVHEDTNIDLNILKPAVFNAIATLDGERVSVPHVMAKKVHEGGKLDTEAKDLEFHSFVRMGDTLEVPAGVWDTYMMLPFRRNRSLRGSNNVVVLASRQEEVEEGDVREVEVEVSTINLSLKFLRDLNLKPSGEVYINVRVEPALSQVQVGDAVDVQTYHVDLTKMSTSREVAFDVVPTTGTVVVSITNDSGPIRETRYLTKSQPLRGDISFVVDLNAPPTSTPLDVRVGGKPLVKEGAQQETYATFRFNRPNPSMFSRRSSQGSLEGTLKDILHLLPVNQGTYQDVYLHLDGTSWRTRNWSSDTGVLAFDEPQIKITPKIDWNGVSAGEKQRGQVLFKRTDAKPGDNLLQKFNLLNMYQSSLTVDSGTYEVWLVSGYTSKRPEFPVGAVKLGSCVKL